MDNNQQTPVTDDQELAKVLAGMNQHASPMLPTSDEPVEEAAPHETPELQFEETPLDRVEAEDPETLGTEPATDTLPEVEAPALDAPVEPVSVAPELTPLVSPVIAPDVTPSASPELDGIKKDALEQLRPLVDKLDLPPEEKFDTLLLIIRSTDDKSLVNATFDAAKAITDETKRAQALLDVIKEIDYFSAQK